MSEEDKKKTDAGKPAGSAVAYGKTVNVFSMTSKIPTDGNKDGEGKEVSKTSEMLNKAADTVDKLSDAASDARSLSNPSFTR